MIVGGLAATEALRSARSLLTIRPISISSLLVCTIVMIEAAAIVTNRCIFVAFTGDIILELQTLAR